MQHTGDNVTARVTQRDSWQGFQLQKLAMRGGDRHPVPAMLLLPAGSEAPHPCVIAVHGFTDKKEAWIEINGYTKGGNVSLGLLRNGYAVLALDMYHHGENNVEHLSGTPFLMVAAEKDEEVDFAEAQWLFSRLPGENKRFISFDSGHSLPLDYVDVVVKWFASCL